MDIRSWVNRLPTSDRQTAVASLAIAASVTEPAVRHWVSGQRRVPAHHCIAIEQATTGEVSRHDLRPDVFGPAPADVAEHNSRVAAQKRRDDLARVPAPDILDGEK